jgi:PadR family transcriptional regulator PadR
MTSATIQAEVRTLYPILMRLAERKLLETSWEPAEIGRPPRHMYRLTPEGMGFAKEHHLQPATGAERAWHLAG